MKKELEQLTSEQYMFLLNLHRRIFYVNDGLQQQRCRTFENKVYNFKLRGYDVEEFERCIKVYRKVIPYEDDSLWIDGEE